MPQTMLYHGSAYEFWQEQTQFYILTYSECGQKEIEQKIAEYFKSKTVGRFGPLSSLERRLGKQPDLSVKFFNAERFRQDKSRSMGHDAYVDITIRGLRTKEQIDVLRNDTLIELLDLR